MAVLFSDSRRFSLLAALVLLPVGPSLAAQPAAKPAVAAAQVIELLANDFTVVEATRFSQSVALTGTLQPWQQTQLSAEIEAAVEDVYVRPGETVKKGGRKWLCSASLSTVAGGIEPSMWTCSSALGSCCKNASSSGMVLSEVRSLKFKV